MSYLCKLGWAIAGILGDARPLLLLTVVLVLLGWYARALQYITFILVMAVVVLIAGAVLKVSFDWNALKTWVLPPRMALYTLLLALGLFLFTDQGRDLGTGLLEASLLQVAAFGFALLYWAIATWHTARVAYDREQQQFSALPATKISCWRLLWYPRLLASAVYGLGMLTIAWAERRAGASLLAYAPCLCFVVVILTFGVVTYPSTISSAIVRRLRKMPALIIILCVVVLIATVCSGTGRVLPQLAAPISAAFFLLMALLGVLEQLYALPLRLVTSRLLTARPGTSNRLYALPRRLLRSRLSTALLGILKRLGAPVRRLVKSCFDQPSPCQRQLCLFAQGSGIDTQTGRRFNREPHLLFVGPLLTVAIVIVLCTWRDPVVVGETFGSVAIAFLAFGVCMTVLEGVWLFRGERTRVTLTFVFLLAVAAGLARDYHVVRTCASERERCHATASAEDKRPSVEEAVEVWRQEAMSHRPARTPSEAPSEAPVPMIVVATAGGGLRAAYWTALMLERIEASLTPQAFRQHLFAISGVSGGSLGAAFYASALQSSRGSDKNASKRLERDFLAPALAAMAFADGPASIAPDVGFIPNRGYALERSWEAATDGGLEIGFEKLFNPRGGPWRPALLLNATHQETGSRVIASHLKLHPRIFREVADLREALGADVPASTAVHNSARFSYVSPAGRLTTGGTRVGFVLDGGYFENYGAITALQLVRHVAVEQKQRVRPIIIIVISSDPALEEQQHRRPGETSAPKNLDADQRAFCQGTAREPLRAGNGWEHTYLNEFIAPAAGILASREAHGKLAVQELRQLACGERSDLIFVHFLMCRDDTAAPPLGWVLSEAARNKIRGMIDHSEDGCGNRARLEWLKDRFSPRSPPPS